jgi:hypothetical protein
MTPGDPPPRPSRRSMVDRFLGKFADPLPAVLE